MLIDKKKAKEKMEEFIVDCYWTKSTPSQFTDVYEKFSAVLSKGSVANYLDELLSEKRIRKWRNGNMVFYGPPKMHLAVKLCIIVTLICLPLVFLSFIWQPLFYLLFFDAGVLFTGFFWWFFSKKEG